MSHRRYPLPTLAKVFRRRAWRDYNDPDRPVRDGDMRLRDFPKGHPTRTKLTKQINAVLTQITADRDERIFLVGELYDDPFIVSTLDLTIGDVKAFNRFAYDDHGHPDPHFLRYLRSLR